MPAFQDEQGGRKRDPPTRQLWTALREIDRNLSSQSAWLVNRRINGKLGSGFGQLFEAEADPASDLARAA
jgi:hypothetical protein